MITLEVSKLIEMYGGQLIGVEVSISTLPRVIVNVDYHNNTLELEDFPQLVGGNIKVHILAKTIEGFTNRINFFKSSAEKHDDNYKKFDVEEEYEVKINEPNLKKLREMNAERKMEFLKMLNLDPQLKAQYESDMKQLAKRGQEAKDTYYSKKTVNHQAEHEKRMTKPQGLNNADIEIEIYQMIGETK